MFGIKQLLLILGVVVILRLIGKVMKARKNINDQKIHQTNKSAQDFQKAKSKQNFGKTTIEKVDKTSINDSDYSDFEEIK